MFNHVRTLLLNRSGDKVPGATFLGEEPVPVQYRQRPLSSGVESLRRVLFGSNPDRAGLNYRLRQFMPLLHAGPWRDHVTALDSRITYNPLRTSDLFASAVFQPVAIPVLGTTELPVWLGSEQNPDSHGRLFHEWLVKITDESTATVYRRTLPVTTSVQEFTVSNQLSSPISLTGSGYSIRCRGVAGSYWVIRVYVRPQQTISDLRLRLRQGNEASLAAVLDLEPGEPFKTFREMWRRGQETTTQMAGVLLALAYTMHDIIVPPATAGLTLGADCLEWTELSLNDLTQLSLDDWNHLLLSC